MDSALRATPRAVFERFQRVDGGARVAALLAQDDYDGAVLSLDAIDFDAVFSRRSS
jgi:hypothetical protein